MTQQKGFALVEVLVSMFLLSTLILFLLQQLALQKQLLHELLLISQASQFLNQVEELRLARVSVIPEPHPPFRLQISSRTHGLFWGNYSVIRLL